MRLPDFRRIVDRPRPLIVAPRETVIFTRSLGRRIAEKTVSS